MDVKWILINLKLNWTNRCFFETLFENFLDNNWLRHVLRSTPTSQSKFKIDEKIYVWGKFWAKEGPNIIKSLKIVINMIILSSKFGHIIKSSKWLRKISKLIAWKSNIKSMTFVIKMIIKIIKCKKISPDAPGHVPKMEKFFD